MKTNETGHYKNVVSLNELKVFAEGLGVAYTPQKDYLKLPNLVLLLDEANALHIAVREQINTVTLSIDSRQLVYKNVKPLSTRVINTMASTNVNSKTIEDAKFFNAKIQGSRITKKVLTKNEKQETTTNSVSRQSFDSIYENFNSLQNLLVQDGNYMPSEADINNAGLTSKKNEMLTANLNIKLELNDLANKRILRNNKFYVNEDSLIAVGRDFKKYIKGKYGTKSAEFGTVKKILFRDLRIK